MIDKKFFDILKREDSRNISFKLIKVVRIYIDIIDKKVIKSAGRMPRLLEAMKDVISCDKLRGGAISFDPKISEWGNPAM